MSTDISQSVLPWDFRKEREMLSHVTCKWQGLSMDLPVPPDFGHAHVLFDSNDILKHSSFLVSFCRYLWESWWAHTSAKFSELLTVELTMCTHVTRSFTKSLNSLWLLPFARSPSTLLKMPTSFFSPLIPGILIETARWYLDFQEVECLLIIMMGARNMCLTQI